MGWGGERGLEPAPITHLPAAEREQCRTHLQRQSPELEEETREKHGLVLARVGVPRPRGGCRLQVSLCGEQKVAQWVCALRGTRGSRRDLGSAGTR